MRALKTSREVADFSQRQQAVSMLAMPQRRRRRREREREGERERERERERDRQRDRETERKREREKEKEGERGGGGRKERGNVLRLSCLQLLTWCVLLPISLFFFLFFCVFFRH